MKINKLSDILPLIEEGYNLVEIGNMLRPKRKPQTMYKYMMQLKKAGYVIDLKKGRPYNKI